MAKDIPAPAEAGKGAPSAQPDRVGPVAGHVDPEPGVKKLEEPKDSTADVQKLLDEAGKTATEQKPAEVELPKDTHFIGQALRLPKHVTIKGHSLASPQQHAKAMGGVKTRQRVAQVNGQPDKFEDYHPFHAAAEALHGWREHEHHEGAPIQLTADEYTAALKAASAPVTRVADDVERNGEKYSNGADINSHKAAELGVPVVTDYEPHPAALSPHRGKGL